MRDKIYFEIEFTSKIDKHKYKFNNIIDIRQRQPYIELLQIDKRTLEEQYITICNSEFNNYAVTKQEGYIDG